MNENLLHNFPLMCQHGMARVNKLLEPIAGKEITRAKDIENQIICGDNLKVMLDLIEKGYVRMIDLIYIDPPYNSNRDYYCTNGEFAFTDKYVGGVLMYCRELYSRLLLMKMLLSEKGSIYVHVDSNVSHYVKLMLDDIFGIENFQREIIWRMGWCSGYKTTSRNWIRNHDVILYYSFGKNPIFNKEYIPYPEDYVRRDGKKPTGKGFPIEDTWNCSEQDQLNSIQLMSFSKEKTGYPTQKPEALLERIIKASSNEGSIVADFYAGSGTTGVVAKRLNRKYILCDCGEAAYKTMLERLKDEANN